MNAGALAYAHTRVRAARGRLVEPLRLRIADTAAARASALIEMGLGDGTPLDAFRVLMSRLAADYARVLRSIPGDKDPFVALRGRHEVENLKLLWRAVTRGHPPARWTPWWRHIGVFALDDFRGVRSAGELVERAGLYSSISGGDLEAVERALDRFATRRIADAAKRSEPDLAQILTALVRERELDRRGDPGPRRRLCQRAFLRGPFSRTGAAALLLVEEDVMAEVIARAEAV